MTFVLIIVTFILGFLIDYVASGKKIDEQGIIPSLKFKLGKFKFHIHHWIGLILLIFILLIIGYKNNYIYSFLVGMIVRSWIMPDAFKIITKI